MWECLEESGDDAEASFFYYSSMKFEMLINGKCRDVDLTMCLSSHRIL